MDRPAGAAAQEPAIEVTPEMIEAGAKVLLTSGDECLRQLGWISAELIATEVLQAALAVRTKNRVTAFGRIR